jgi:hypothetical protein
MKTAISIIDLYGYGNDGISICLTVHNDICGRADDAADIEVIGYPVYASSLEDARQSILRDYLAR